MFCEYLIMKLNFRRIQKFLLFLWAVFFVGLLFMVKGGASNEPTLLENKTNYEQVLVVFSYDLTNYASLEKYAEILEKFDQVDGINFSFEFFDAAKTALDD